jgi:ribose-phosphate pyrophosphokinase
MVDDLITTAGTLCSAAELLAKSGARDVYAAVSHVTLTPLGLDRLKSSKIKELVVTDTVPLPASDGFPITVLTVSELLGEAMQRIHNNQSVTSLFKL